MEFKTLIKFVVTLYIAVVLTIQTALFLVGSFVEDKISQLELVSANISHQLKDAEKLAFLVALGMVENHEVLPFIERELRAKGISEFGDLVKKIEEQTN